MLELNSVDNTREYVFNIDEYIPFSIDFIKNYCELIYFRFGNGSTSLMEISIDKISLEICSITLVSIDINDIFLCNKKMEEDAVFMDTGFPIFECNNLLKADDILYFDCFYNDIKLFIDNQSVCVYIGENKTVKYIKNYNIFFGFDHCESLNSIIVENIPINDIELIKKSIL